VIKIDSISRVKAGFEVLQTTKQSQSAVMVLAAGEKSSEEMNTHRKSDQVLLLLEGKLRAEVGKEKRAMEKGETCIVPAGIPHRFSNCGKKRAVSFNIYSPPEYPPGEKG
jgi:mannose-6-phosphate isomerase-like protein (cupin superfamily)